MRVTVTTCMLLMMGICLRTTAQPILKTGDLFPDMMIRPILNAPVRVLDPRQAPVAERLLILNFWATWCSPCLPEMDSLDRLQQRNKGLIRVVGISDDPVNRLQAYLARKKSDLWLASDTAGFLYRMLALNYVGQAAILDKQGRMLAIVRTDSINQAMIDRLLRGETVVSSGATGNKEAPDADPFAVDSSMGQQLVWGGYRPGMPSMSKTYLKTALEGRRISYFNVCPENIYRDIYRVSYTQVEYEGDKKSYCRWDDKRSLVCLDLLVAPERKDSLMIILGQMMDKMSPVRARKITKSIPVYLLRQIPGAGVWQESTAAENLSFSGRGYDGRGITMNKFSEYVANELQLPVVNETGLGGRYDIHTENVLRTREDMLAALKKLGLSVEKTEREMDVVIIYRND